MAAVPVTFQGILFFSDVGVGGGPMPGGPPLGFWGGVAPPYVDIGPPGQQPGVWPSPGRPTQPIYWPPHPSQPIYNPGGPPGSSPPGYWGGGMGPGVKPQPPGSPGGPPLGFWGGTPPSYVDIGFPSPQPPPGSRPPQGGMPGQLPGSDPSGSGWVWAYVPGHGWMWAQVPPAPTDPDAPHPDHTLPVPPAAGTPAPPQAGQLPSTPIAQPVKK